MDANAARGAARDRGQCPEPDRAGAAPPCCPARVDGAGTRGARSIARPGRIPAGLAPDRRRPVRHGHASSPARNSSAHRGGTLGDVLFAKPGITGSSFAPGAASRPIVRGLDTYRVRIQENGIGASGVSELGEDHAVPLDPLAADRIEVVRGPATLRFGSQAIGGVVNATNNRIPDAIRAGPRADRLRISHQSRCPRRGAGVVPEFRDARRRHHGRQRPRRRRDPRRRRRQLRLPRRRVRPARRRLPHSALSLSAAARPVAAVQRPAAEFGDALRRAIGRRLLHLRSAALSASRCRAIRRASIACRASNRPRPTPAST